jgi:peptide/nickel transport system substrate-binding protein
MLQRIKKWPIRGAVHTSQTTGGTARRKRYLLGLVVIASATLAVVLAFSTAQSDARSTASPQRGGTLNIDIPLTITSANPYALPYDPGSFRIVPLIFDSLLEYVPGKSAPVPSLATSWDISKDGLTYTFHLRKNVHFTNGDPFTAADVVFSLKAFQDLAKTTGSQCCSQMNTITATNANTVRLTLKAPAPVQLYWLTTGGPAPIVDSRYYKRVGAKYFKTHPVGTGAWKVKSFSPGVLSLVRNPQYWQAGKPYLDAMTVRSVADANTRTLDVRSGRAQVATEVPYAQANSLKNVGNARLLNTRWAATYVGQINSQSPPMSETAVRRALSYATNRSAILQTALGGIGTVANSMSVNVGDWDPTIRQLPYDLNLAKQELAKSSVPNGFPLKISIETGDTTASITAAILQDSFKKIGIDATIEATDPATFISNTIAGKYQLQVDPPNWWVSPIPQVDLWFTSVSIPGTAHSLFTWYNNPTAEKLAQQLLVAPNPATHRKLAVQLQQITVDDPPLLSYAFLQNLTLVGSSVCNFSVPVTQYLYNQAGTYLAKKC